jgi:N-acetyl sugar amidotransferase
MIRLVVVNRGYGDKLTSPVVDNQVDALINTGEVQIHRFIIKRGGLHYFLKLRAFRKFVKTNSIDLIHAHYSFCGFFASLSFTGKPVVCSLMGSDVLRNNLLNFMTRFFAAKIWKKTIVKSKQMQRKQSKAVVIPNGVDFNNFKEIDFTISKNRVGFRTDSKNILFIAVNPYVKEKNFRLAEEAVDILSKRTQQKIILHKITNSSFQELPYYYSGADLLLLTSISEGSPNVIKEAMACNCPIVATNVGDISEVIGTTKDCFITNFDPENIANSIEKCLESKSRTNGRINISNLNNTVINEKLIKLYLDVKTGSNLTPPIAQHDLMKAEKEHKVCAKGLWNETVPGITFDSNDVSNYAKLFETLSTEFPRGLHGKQTWENLVLQIKEKGKHAKYDCVIGVSGGTDSCYLLHIIKKYGLRPLAVNLDNGWNSEIAVSNIEKITKALDIDLKTYVINYEEVKDLLKSYMRAGLPWIDMPTDLAIKSILYKIASKEGIKYILRGNDFRSEGTQPKEWTYGDGRQLNYLHKKFGSVKLKTYPNYTIQNLIYYGVIKQIKSIYPFYYLDYKKSEAQKFLIENYDWRYYGGHHHENLFTKFAITYWLKNKFGIDKRIISFSALVMSNEMSRADALDQLKKLPYDESEIEETISYVLKKLDLSRDEFNLLLNRENFSYYDYPSYDFVLQRLIKIGRPFLKLLFVHKPQSMFQAEMRNKKKC